MVSEEKIFFKFFFLFFYLAFWFPWQPIKMSSRPKIIQLIEDCLSDSSMKFRQNIHKGLAVNVIFKSMETVSCHSNQTKEPNFIKKKKKKKKKKNYSGKYGEYFHKVSAP